MDHRFSKHEYFVSCSLTILFAGFAAASYFDISTCPYRYTRGTSTAETGGGGGACKAHVYGRGGAESSRSLFASVAQEGGLTCHMADLVIWVYIVTLLLFMSHKYYYYRMRGLHYFLLDYCYFHNACLVLFLLWYLVDVRWSQEPLVSWEAYLPQEWLSERNARLAGAADGGLNRSIKDVAVRATPLVNQTWTNWAQRFIPSTAWQRLLIVGIYKPVSVDIVTIGYTAAEASSPDEVLLNFLLFFALVAGSFGPILGAILMWSNSLLFHSFDRMSSSYLHLAPAGTQLLLLHRLLTSAKQELASIDAAPDGGSPAHATGALWHKVDAVCGAGTLCHDMRHAVSYWTLLKLHSVMFIAWQIFYHTFSEGRRHSRKKKHNKKMQEISARHKEFCRLTGAVAAEAELLRPILVLSEGIVGDPTHRATAYTWLMQHPPLGKEGVLYRFVTMFGTGYLPTMVLFQVTQWLLHVAFFTLAYPVMHYSFHVALSAAPLALYLISFLLYTVYNAAAVNKRWIQKLQRLAAIGMEAQRQHTGASLSAAANSGGTVGHRE
ncbi:hypothetical protein TraAM80_04751 [Trypanosoma rangeli]|uniref:Glycerophosphocholine acyltransferase 1 n=1 Tax=Trypanosoma rangeli TaxID=5698 RepID=A0A422NIA4_TRYRA|nr:uncharacterized protein TraAM80_04751 [Trypanosoma rangeli]RNF05179.1 hypothetical protein TraAM80_04751 [Trypanosoma rangeli]|eukprot:RNF05179.1 hypothetical protein TraAM80_04751 [Trypanosoma rangeli]